MRNLVASQRGVALLLTFLMMLVLAGLAVAVAVCAHNSLVTGHTALLDQQAFYIAQGGWQRARQAILATTWTAAPSPGNTYTESFGAGEYRVTVVDNGSNSETITAEGYVPNQTATLAKRQLIESAVPVTVNDGTNQSLTATASASSSGSGNPAGNANDGDTTTDWQAGIAGTGQWLAMDYGASPPTLNKIVVLEHANVSGVAIEQSDDNASWSTPGGLSVIESPVKTWTATFTAASHRYVRAVLTASGSSRKVSVKEMQSFDSALSALGNGSVTTAW